MLSWAFEWSSLNLKNIYIQTNFPVQFQTHAISNTYIHTLHCNHGNLSCNLVLSAHVHTSAKHWSYTKHRIIIIQIFFFYIFSFVVRSFVRFCIISSSHRVNFPWMWFHYFFFIILGMCRLCTWDKFNFFASYMRLEVY